MNPRSFQQVLSIASVIVVCSSQLATAQYGDLVKRIPANANTLVLLNVDQAHDSPLGRQEGWRENHEREFASGLVIVPPSTSKFVMAAQLDFDYMHPVWECALMDLKYEPSMPRVAAKHGGTVDTIGGREAAALPQDIYAVKFGPRFGGIMAPANRQRVSQWVNAIYSNSLPPLSAYLDEAVRFAEGGSPLIMAMDLNNIAVPAHVRQRLNEFECLEGLNADLDHVTEVLCSIRGVMLGVTIGDKRFGKIKIDFGMDAAPLEPFAKPLLLEILAKRGAMIEEFNDWEAKVNGTQVTLEGWLYESGTRRLLSILDAPPSFQHQAQSASSEGESQEQVALLSSQQYFNSITSLLDDLRGRRQSDEFTTWGQVGMWFEKYARKIDQLPILNVDDELLEYGAFVSDALRQSESAMKGIGARSGYRKTQQGKIYNYQSSYTPVGMTRWGVGGVYSWRATEDVRAEQQAQSKIRTQEKIRGNMSANTIMQGVEAATGDIRRVMTKKYGVEF